MDATNLTRNLYLTIQLMELGIPVVLAINMMDEMKNNGGSILINEMERLLQIPVVPISAVKNQGVGELREACDPCRTLSGEAGHHGFLR